MKLGTPLLLSLFLTATSCAQSTSQKIPRGMSVVQPVSRPSAPASGAGELHISRGRFFSYAMPQGWRVGEEGQFAVSLAAPDSQAFTFMVGNAGLPPSYPPDRFVWEKMMAL